MTYTQSVYDSAAFSTQQRYYYCTAAVAQYIRNLTRADVYSESEQTTMYNYGRSQNRYAYSAKGNDPDGLCAILNNYSAGGVATWHVVKKKTLQGALKAVASRMRATGLPGVLFVSGGGHVWTMDGYKSDVDPNSGSFTVTNVRFSGPLYPNRVKSYGYYDWPPGTWKTAGWMSYPFFKYSEYYAFRDHKIVVWQGYFVVIVP